jgi:hypothetical protein
MPKVNPEYWMQPPKAWKIEYSSSVGSKCDFRLKYFTTGERLYFAYLLTPWSRILLKKLTVSELVNKFLAFYGTLNVITEFTTVRHLFISWARSNQPMPHSTCWRSILMLSSRLRLGLPSGLFPSGFPTKTFYKPLLSALRAMWLEVLRYLSVIAVPGHALPWLSPIPSRHAPSRPVVSPSAPSYTIPSHPVISRRVPSRPVYLKTRVLECTVAPKVRSDRWRTVGD